MAVQQTRKWKCDLCGKEETTYGTSYHTSYPKDWAIDLTIRSYFNGSEANRSILTADFCCDCTERTFKYGNTNKKQIAENELKRPFWRKIFPFSDAKIKGGEG